MVDVSVVVPTAGRPDLIVRLLEALARQTLPADRFEVVVTDDGSDPPVAPRLAQLALPYRLECEWQPRSGPAAARNRAIAKARGRLLVILNDDAGPPPDLLERHVAAHAESNVARAFLGGFDFAPDCETPFAVAVTRLGLVFPFHELDRAGPNGGRFFWTCNLSVPRQAVLDAGGFDASFTRPICEDVELGVRLEQRGVRVHFLGGAPCLHHHRVDVEWFARRQVELGVWMVHTWRKHGDPALLPWLAFSNGDATRLAALLELGAATRGRQFESLVREIAAVDVGLRGAPAAGVPFDRAVAAIESRVRSLNEELIRLGLFAGLTRRTSEQAWEWLAALPSLTTLVAPPGADVDVARIALRRAGAPAELVAIGDEGGGALRENLLARARGERICLLTSGFAGEPGWLARAIAATNGAARVEPGRFRLVRRDELARGQALARPLETSLTR
jgi:GT2 family glycosyltransferase